MKTQRTLFYLLAYSIGVFGVYLAAHAEEIVVTEPEVTAAADAISPTTPTRKIPSISIGGRDVITIVNRTRHRGVVIDAPEKLRDPKYANSLKRRHQFPTPHHAPHQGTRNRKADFTLIEFSDPGCFTCQTAIKTMEDAIKLAKNQPNIGTFQRFHIYAQSETAGPLGLAAFYGRVAARLGAFWAYHTALISLNNPDEHAYFNILVNLGASALDIRKIAIQDARKIYTELDEDTLSVQKKSFPRAPFWLLNGILISEEHGIPAALLPDVIIYETRRLTAKKLGPRP